VVVLLLQVSFVVWYIVWVSFVPSYFISYRIISYINRVVHLLDNWWFCFLSICYWYDYVLTNRNGYGQIGRPTVKNDRWHLVGLMAVRSITYGHLKRSWPVTDRFLHTCKSSDRSSTAIPLAKWPTVDRITPYTNRSFGQLRSSSTWRGRVSIAGQDLKAVRSVINGHAKSFKIVYGHGHWPWPFRAINFCHRNDTVSFLSQKWHRVILSQKWHRVILSFCHSVILQSAFLTSRKSLCRMTQWQNIADLQNDTVQNDTVVSVSGVTVSFCTVSFCTVLSLCHSVTEYQRYTFGLGFGAPKLKQWTVLKKLY